MTRRALLVLAAFLAAPATAGATVPLAPATDVLLWHRQSLGPVIAGDRVLWAEPDRDRLRLYAAPLAGGPRVELPGVRTPPARGSGAPTSRRPSGGWPRG